MCEDSMSIHEALGKHPLKMQNSNFKGTICSVLSYVCVCVCNSFEYLNSTFNIYTFQHMQRCNKKVKICTLYM